MVRIKRLAEALVLAALLCAFGSPGGCSAAADDQPLFKPSALPPPEPEQETPVSFFDLLTTSDTSPLGTPASSVKSTDLIAKAASFLNDGPRGREDPQEAAYWLKRAIMLAPDDSGRRRAWALTNLAIVTYNSGDAHGHAAARYLWQIAGAWHSPEALCNLGKIAMLGDDVAPADTKQAIVWYERAKELGCPQADEALTRLKR